MKALKILSAAIIIVISLGFVSCSNDDDYSSSDLAGTWLIIQSEGYDISRINSEEDKDEWSERYPDDVDRDSDVGLYMKLEEDGSAYVGYSLTKMVYNGKWSVRKDKLVLEYEDSYESFTQGWTILKNTSTELVIEYKMSETEKDGNDTYYYETYQKMTLQRVD